MVNFFQRVSARWNGSPFQPAACFWSVFGWLPGDNSTLVSVGQHRQLKQKFEWYHFHAREAGGVARNCALVKDLMVATVVVCVIGRNKCRCPQRLCWP
jgi:hypothetical protein